MIATAPPFDGRPGVFTAKTASGSELHLFRRISNTGEDSRTIDINWETMEAR